MLDCLELRFEQKPGARGDITGSVVPTAGLRNIIPQADILAVLGYATYNHRGQSLIEVIIIGASRKSINSYIIWFPAFNFFI